MTLAEILAAISPVENGFTVTIGPTWGQGRATFGGIVAAVGNESMRKLVAPDRPLRSLQTTFVGPASAGPWQIRPRVLRAGKAATLVQCDVLDGDLVIATQVAVYGLGRPSIVSVRPPTVTPARAVDELQDMRYVEGQLPEFVQHFAVRWSEGSPPFSGAPRAPTKAFIRHRDPAPTTESHIVALVDCIPTPAISMFAGPAPASSIVWVLEFFEHEFAFSNEQWWRIDTDIDAANGGYVHQTGVLNDPDGRPVALTRQMVVVFG
jgi:acyl-CoA thioesterase